MILAEYRQKMNFASLCNNYFSVVLNRRSAGAEWEVGCFFC
jgi:hypothetical protein